MEPSVMNQEFESQNLNSGALNAPTPKQVGKQHGPYNIQTARLITSRTVDSEVKRKNW